MHDSSKASVIISVIHEQSVLDYCHNYTQSSDVNLSLPVQLISKVDMNCKSGIRDNFWQHVLLVNDFKIGSITNNIGST